MLKSSRQYLNTQSESSNVAAKSGCSISPIFYQFKIISRYKAWLPDITTAGLRYEFTKPF